MSPLSSYRFVFALLLASLVCAPALDAQVVIRDRIQLKPATLATLAGHAAEGRSGTVVVSQSGDLIVRVPDLASAGESGTGGWNIYGNPAVQLQWSVTNAEGTATSSFPLGDYAYEFGNYGWYCYGWYYRRYPQYCDTAPLSARQLRQTKYVVYNFEGDDINWFSLGSVQAGDILEVTYETWDGQSIALPLSVRSTEEEDWLAEASALDRHRFNMDGDVCPMDLDPQRGDSCPTADRNRIRVRFAVEPSAAVLVADSDNDGVVGSAGDEAAEYADDRVGALLLYNDDDDDNDDIPDYEDTDVPGEDDLGLLRIDVEPVAGLEYRLEAFEGDQNVRLWTQQSKGEEVTLPATFGADDLPDELFVEGIAWNDTSSALAFYGYDPAEPADYIVADTVGFYSGTQAYGMDEELVAGQMATVTLFGLPDGSEVEFVVAKNGVPRAPVIAPASGVAALTTFDVSESWGSAGDVYTVVAKADGGRLLFMSDEFTIVPAAPAAATAEPVATGAVADGAGQLSTRVTVRDAYGNAVADSTPVSLALLSGTAEFDANTPTGFTLGGEVLLNFDAPFDGGAGLRPLAPGLEGDSVYVPAGALTASLSATTNELDVQTGGTSTVTLSTNAADGAEVRWSVSSVAPGAPSTFTSQVSAGAASLVVGAQGAPVGPSVITATIGARRLVHVIYFDSSAPVRTEVINRVIAGDVAAIAGSDDFGWGEGFNLADGSTYDGGETAWSTAGPALSSPAQVSLYDETFGLPDGTTVDSSASPWTLQSPGDIAVQNGRLRIGVTGQAYWVSGPIDLGAAPGPVRIEVEAGVEGAHVLGDLLTFEYRIDGGTWMLFDECREVFAVCLGRLSAGTAYQTSTEGIEGQTLEVRVGAQNSRNAYFLDRVAVTYEARPTFSAQNGRFVARDFDGPGAFEERVWESEPISITGAPVEISLSALSFGQLEADDQIVAAYRLNGGPETVFAQHQGAFLGAPNAYTNIRPHESQTLSVGGLTGQTLQVIVRARLDEAGEGYAWDNVTVQRENAPTVEAWTAGFDDLPSGATAGTGNPAWSLDASRVRRGVFSVQNGRFKAANTDGVGVWQSGPIDIAAGVADLDLSLQAEGQLARYDVVRAYYRVDGGAWTLIAERSHRFNGYAPVPLSVDGIAGETLEVEVYMFSAVNGALYLNNLEVTTTEPRSWVLRRPYRYEVMETPAASLGSGNPQPIYSSDVEVPVGTEVIVRGAPETQYTFRFTGSNATKIVAVDGTTEDPGEPGTQLVTTDENGNATVQIRSLGDWQPQDPQQRYEAVQFELALQNGDVSWTDEVYVAPQTTVGALSDFTSGFFGGTAESGYAIAGGIAGGVVLPISDVGVVLRNVWHMMPATGGDVDKAELSLALLGLGLEPFFILADWADGPITTVRQIVGFMGDVPARVHLLNALVRAAKVPDFRAGFVRLVADLGTKPGFVQYFKQVVTSGDSYEAMARSHDEFGESFSGVIDRAVLLGCSIPLNAPSSRTRATYTEDALASVTSQLPSREGQGCSSAALRSFTSLLGGPLPSKTIRAFKEFGDDAMLDGLVRMIGKTKLNGTDLNKFYSSNLFEAGFDIPSELVRSDILMDEVAFTKRLVKSSDAISSDAKAIEAFNFHFSEIVRKVRTDPSTNGRFGGLSELIAWDMLISRGILPDSDLFLGLKHSVGGEIDAIAKARNTLFEVKLNVVARNEKTRSGRKVTLLDQIVKPGEDYAGYSMTFVTFGSLEDVASFEKYVDKQWRSTSKVDITINETIKL